MHLRLALSVITACWMGSAGAMIVHEQTPRGTLGLGLSSLYREQPDGTREQRYRIDLLSLDRLLPWLRWENRIGIARDTRPRSQSVRVHEDLYDLYSGLRLTYPFFFRLGLSLGPLLQWHQTTIELDIDQDKREKDSTWEVGWQAQLSLDYAINRDWELLGFLAWQVRPLARKSDLSFGFALLLNSSIRASKSEDRRAPAEEMVP